jgi:hypothetical protein
MYELNWLKFENIPRRASSSAALLGLKKAVGTSRCCDMKDYKSSCLDEVKVHCHDVHARSINYELSSELSNDQLLDELSKLTFQNPIG